MPVIFIDVLFAALSATAGLAAGWWLWEVRADRPDSEEESKRAREVLTRLHDVATRVAADVGQHNTRVEAINEELHAADAGESDAVLGAVAKLIEANAQMQKQLASADERLREQAHTIECHALEARTDNLTLLANRRAMDDELAARADEFHSRGRALSVVMFDVDHFKKFNDAYGHQAGDEILRGVARVLRTACGDHGVAARYGGEEFALVLPDLTLGETLELADRARTAIDSARFQFEAAQFHVTVSAGAAEMLTDDNPAAVLKRADAAMYASKKSGRNCTHWHDGQKSQRYVLPPPPAARPRPAAPAPAPVLRQGDTVHRTIASRPAAQAPEIGSGHQFRAELGRRMEEWKRGGRRPSVLMVAIDNFAGLSAEYGEKIAGLVHRTTVQFLKAAVRPMDFVAEQGGATFSLMLPGASLENAVTIAERLRQAIDHCALPLEGKCVRFSVSIGGADLLASDDAPNLAGRAQEALSAAKRAGGNRSVFHTGRKTESAAEIIARLSDRQPVAP